MNRFHFTDKELAKILLRHLKRVKKLRKEAWEVPYKVKLWVEKQGETIVLTIEFSK